MRVIGYARVSTQGQGDNTSTDSQALRIKRHCEMMNYELVEVVTEVQSASGKVLRKELVAALGAIDAGAADGLIVCSVDRFARSLVEGLRIMEDLRQAGKALIILDLNLDTSTPIGECMFSMLLSFAQLERKMIHKRCSEGRLKVIERGGYVSGRPPYGSTKGSEDGKKKLVDNEFEKEVIANILSMRADGHSYRSITKWLNRANIATRSGKEWNFATVRVICVRWSEKINSVEVARACST